MRQISLPVPSDRRIGIRTLIGLVAFVAVLASCGESEPAESSLPPVPSPPAASPPPAPTLEPPDEPAPLTTPDPTDTESSDGAVPTPEPTQPPSGPISSEPPATGVFEPPPTPAARADDGAASRCRNDRSSSFDVIDVAVDDPDGGLVVHEGVGVDSPVTGVFPWHTRGINWWGECAFTENGSEWWQVSGPDFTHGWVNARYLGQRTVAGDALAETPCRPDGIPSLPVGEPGVPSDEIGETLAVTDIRIESSNACDRLVVEFGVGWAFDAVPRPLDALPFDAVSAIDVTDSELEVELHPSFATAFDSLGPAEIWRDEATGEQNVALVLDRDERTRMYVGWGHGRAGVRFENDPARMIVDIAQTATPQGELSGPIAGGRFGPILFDPIAPTLDGDGLTDSFVVRGFSRGFEASSYVDIRPWSQTVDAHPGAWQGALFGVGELSRQVPRPDGLTFDPPAPTWASSDWSTTPFTTPGYFEFEISGLAPGGWQLIVAPSSGLGCAPVVGQQFRIAGGPASTAPMVPFSLVRSGIEEGDDLVATTVTSVLGTEWIHEGRC